jgi:hypothetical protein
MQRYTAPIFFLWAPQLMNHFVETGFERSARRESLNPA